MERTAKRDTKLTAFTLFIALLNAVLVIFLAQMTVNVRQQVSGLEKQLDRIEDLSQHVQQVRSPGEYLEERCGTCHTERRYLGASGVTDAEKLIERMNAFPDAHIAVEERDNLYGALKMMKCQRCHTDEVFSRLAMLNSKEHSTTILRMWEHAGTELSRQEVVEALKAFERLQEF